MSSVSGKDSDFEISASSSPRLTQHVGSEDSLEPDGDETGFINQTVNEESATKSTLGSLPLKSSDDEDEDENLTTAPVVLIPAIKGSREKHGLTLKKTSVSWAADVYDPPPSIASHTRNKKQQQKSKSKDSHRKNGKKGQKSKDNSNSSRSGKDNKKQASRKHSREKFDWVTQMPIVAASS
ncbi:unnamed protein product [Brassica oleracea]|uniref:uncharacterized protein LOC106342470 n=1 Tax=Brassica oleracea var. oleracea TaxID=109376 RepID=UPI0006A6D630|nr:PREDICTED: uncharacterized protein LOC106342470 [Brassica oleracea var. oleracea]